jgi:AraC family transcriptional regulator
MTYVERSRIQRAKSLIRGDLMPLAEVAQEVGFADQSHFTRRFRVHEGRTPAAYAREHAPRRRPRSRG